MRQPVSANYVVGVIQRYPSERLAILNLLCTSRGYKFASQVLTLLRSHSTETVSVAERNDRATTSGASRVQ